MLDDHHKTRIASLSSLHLYACCILIYIDSSSTLHLYPCWVFCSIFGPILSSGKKVKVGERWLRTQHIDFYLFHLWRKGCAQGKSESAVVCLIWSLGCFSCTEVSKASTSSLRPGFRIDFWRVFA